MVQTNKSSQCAQPLKLRIRPAQMSLRNVGHVTSKGITADVMFFLIARPLMIC